MYKIIGKYLKARLLKTGNTAQCCSHLSGVQKALGSNFTTNKMRGGGGRGKEGGKEEGEREGREGDPLQGL